MPSNSMSAKMVTSTAKPTTPNRINAGRRSFMALRRRIREIAHSLRLAPAKRHCIEHEAGNEAQEPQHQCSGRHYRSWEARDEAGFEIGDEDWKADCGREQRER